VIAVIIPAMRAANIHALGNNVLSTLGADDEVQWAYPGNIDRTPTDVESAIEDEFGGYNLTHYKDPDSRWGHCINSLASLLGKTPWHEYVFLGADDLWFHAGWWEEAMKVMADVDGVVMVNDLCSMEGTLPLVSLNYLRTLGGTVDDTGFVIHEGYWHNFAERELVETAKARGRYAYAPEAVVEHRHWMAGKADRSDPIYQLGELHWDDDAALYTSRQHLWENLRA